MYCLGNPYNESHFSQSSKHSSSLSKQSADETVFFHVYKSINVVGFKLITYSNIITNVMKIIWQFNSWETFSLLNCYSTVSANFFGQQFFLNKVTKYHIQKRDVMLSFQSIVTNATNIQSDRPFKKNYYLRQLSLKSMQFLIGSSNS